MRKETKIHVEWDDFFFKKKIKLIHQSLHLAAKVYIDLKTVTHSINFTFV